MRNKIAFTLFIILCTCSIAHAQKQSFLVLGDIHYDLLEDHDMEWLRKKPDDLRQVTTEYTQFTKNNWPTFSKYLKDKAASHKPGIKAVLQLGDLSEGLAGSEPKAAQMAQSVVNMVNSLGTTAPWIIAKGNHDITGPGAPEAFDKYYISMFQKQLNRKDIISANYAHQIGDNLFVCFDPWDKRTDVLDVLEKNLKSSKAKFKFVMLHEPVIPINERCWHVFRKTPEKRERLLEIIAKNKAIVLSAHMHLYSIIKRETPYGPIVQIMCNSVVKDLKRETTNKVFTRFGSNLAKERPDWQPETLQERIKWLDNEAPFVSYFKQQDLPGFGILTTDPAKGEIFFEYYAAMGTVPYEKICISDLLK